MSYAFRRHLSILLASPVVACTMVLAVGLAATAAAVVGAHHTSESAVRLRVEGHATRLRDEISSRILRAEYGLRGALATYAVTGRLDRGSFRVYMEARNLLREFPGIRGLGFIERVPREELARFIARERGDGAPDFGVRPATGMDPLYVIKYIEPLSRNSPAVGLDVGSEAERRTAAERAVLTGETALTGGVTLVQDERKGAGWLIFVPAYTRPAATERERVAALAGLFYAPIVAAEVLGSLKEFVDFEVDFQLFDGASPDGMALFDSRFPAGIEIGTPQVRPLTEGKYVDDHALVIGGRALTLRVAGTPELSVSGTVAPATVGAAGVLISALLAWATWLLASGRARAMALATSMTSDLRRLAKVVEHTSNAVIGLNEQFEVQWVNEGFTRATGWAPEECTGRTVAELIGHPDENASARATLQDAATRGHSCRVELLRQRKDGTAVWMDVELQPTTDEQGRINGWIEIALDIGLRKQVESMLQTREHLMRVVTDNIPARVTYWDAGLRCRFANQTFCRWFGRTRDELIGQPMSAEIFGPQVWQTMEPLVRLAVQGRHQLFEQEDRSAAGASASWLVHYIPDVEAGTRRVRGLFVLALDITELKTARDAALSASRAKSQFLSSVSHELRTPMNGVLGMLTLLQGASLDARQSDYAGKARDAALSLLSLLDDLLDLAKIEAGKMTLNPRAFGFDKLLRDLSPVLFTLARDKPLEVQFDLDPKVPATLRGDDLRLRQILLNLCSNAIKFTERGDVRLSIRFVRSEGDRALIELAVQDSGIGMTQEEVSRLFAEFAQANTETTRRFGGTGLGLNICQRLAALMGSRIEVTSQSGAGSRFMLQVELLVEQPAPAMPAPQQRMLIVDDHPGACDVLATQARQLGYAPDIACSGEQAIALWRASTGTAYDAVLIDGAIPGLGGWDTLRRLRSMAGGAPFRAVMMAGTAAQAKLDESERSEQGLCDAFLCKPVVASMLQAALQPPVAREVAASTPAKPLAGIRLLVAEDNPINQQIAYELLQAQGANVMLVADGRQAVQALRADPQHYDLVLMDLQMPVLDGYGAAREIRSMPACALLPIIAMTANAMDTDRAACLQAGMNDHVAKPFEVPHLVRAILGQLRDRCTEPVMAPAQRAELATWDREDALHYTGGNAGLLERLLRMFRNSLEESLQRLPTLMADGSSEEIVRFFHTLRGQSATLGARRLSEEAGALESMLSEAAGAGAAPLHVPLEALRTEILEVLEALPGPEYERS